MNLAVPSDIHHSINCALKSSLAILPPHAVHGGSKLRSEPMVPILHPRLERVVVAELGRDAIAHERCKLRSEPLVPIFHLRLEPGVAGRQAWT
jgi:hypothetical protein